MRRELAFAAAAISSMIVLAFVIPLGLLVRTLAEDRAVASAERRTEGLVPVLATVDNTNELTHVIDALNASDAGPVSVFLTDGRVIGAAAANDDNVSLARLGQAFNVDAPGGTAVYVPVQVPNGGWDVIRVFVPDDRLRSGVYPAWILLAGLGLGLVVVATAVADRLGKAIVRPVDDLAVTAERLSDGDLDARVEIGGPPEIVEVGHTLNHLAARISELLTAEREEVADLSHRLRTPVTALRLDVDGLPDGEDKERLVADADALARAVDRLITEARRTVRVGVGAASDLVAMTRDRVSFWAALADEQGRAYDLSVPEHTLVVAVPHDDLEAALDALLGNVFAHTPDGTAFRVRVEPIENEGDDRSTGQPPPCARITVDDDGPGIDSDRAIERGSSGGGSTGLGLDIVRRTAEASGGSLALGTRPGGGAHIVVEFGAPED